MTKKLDNQTILSTLWIIVMFNMAYADILALYIPSTHEELARFAGGKPISLLMLGGAVVLQIPIFMIFLSRVLNHQINRWVNITVGLLMVLFVIGPEIGNDAINPHYYLIASVEVLCLLYIVWTAWQWKKAQDQ